MNDTNINIYQMNLLIALIDKNIVQLNSALWVRRELKISSGKKVFYMLYRYFKLPVEREEYLCVWISDGRICTGMRKRNDGP